MNIAFIILGLLAFIGFGAFFIVASREERERCANGNDPSPHGTGRVGRTFESALSTPFLLAAVGSGAGLADLCAATDMPLGPCMDTPAVDGRATILHLGVTPGTLSMVASKAIDDGELVYTTADGKVTDTAVNNSYLVGRAITAAGADGDVIEVAHCFPVQQSV